MVSPARGEARHVETSNRACGGTGRDREPTRKILSLDNRTRRPLPGRMEHGRSYLMDKCQVTASGGERSPTIITPTLAPSSCPRKQASRGANNSPLAGSGAKLSAPRWRVGN